MTTLPICIQASRQWFWVLLLGIAMIALCGRAVADPPSRAARLAYASGTVSFSPAGESEWVEAALNRPLTTGDRLWADAESRAEVQVGGAALRMGASTSVTLLNLDDMIAQVQLSQGTLKVRVRRLAPDQAFEIDTPNLAFTLRRPGEYRIEVDPAGDATAVMVRSGEGEAYGDGASYVIDSRQGYRFSGTDLRDYQPIAAPDDDFDRWASDRDRRSDDSASARYVSGDVVGYEDLDGNGTWRAEPGYGNVWVPNRVAADWTPYQQGHWAWVDPWGWTWVDDAPWGYAVSHYGRWANLRGTWGWVPGPLSALAVYAPALVAFLVGGGGDVGWFPLGPRDVYRPSYAASRDYFDRVNRSNAAINTTTITNVYNTTNVTNITYANRHVPGAVVAVSTTAFVHAKPVGKARVQVSKEAIASAPVSAVAAVAPVQESVHGAADPGAKRPTRGEHVIVARSAPPAAPVGFAAQQRQLGAIPGRPLDEAARRQLKPIATVPAPKIVVLAAAQAKPPTALPPPAANSSGVSRQPDQRRAPAAAPAPAALASPQPASVPPKAAPSPATRPRAEAERPPLASPPARAPVASEHAPQRARPEPPEAKARPMPPLVLPPQVRPPPIALPILRPVPIARAPQRATPAPLVPPAAPAKHVAPSPVRPEPSPAAQPSARKPAPEAITSVEQKKAEEERLKRKP